MYNLYIHHSAATRWVLIHRRFETAVAQVAAAVGPATLRRSMLTRNLARGSYGPRPAEFLGNERSSKLTLLCPHNRGTHGFGQRDNLHLDPEGGEGLSCPAFLPKWSGRGLIAEEQDEPVLTSQYLGRVEQLQRIGHDLAAL